MGNGWNIENWGGGYKKPELPKPSGETKIPRYGIPKLKLKIGMYLYRYNSQTDTIDTYNVQEWAHQGESYAVFVTANRLPALIKGWFTEQELVSLGFSFYHAAVAEDYCPRELFNVTTYNAPILTQHLNACSQLPLSFGAAGGNTNVQT